MNLYPGDDVLAAARARPMLEDSLRGHVVDPSHRGPHATLGDTSDFSGCGRLGLAHNDGGAVDRWASRECTSNVQPSFHTTGRACPVSWGKDVGYTPAGRTAVRPR